MAGVAAEYQQRYPKFALLVTQQIREISGQHQSGNRHQGFNPRYNYQALNNIKQLADKELAALQTSGNADCK